MADSAIVEEPNKDVRDQSNAETSQADGVEEDNKPNAKGNNTSITETAQPGKKDAEQPKTASKIKQIWGSLGLDLPTALMMLK